MKRAGLLSLLVACSGGSGTADAPIDFTLAQDMDGDGVPNERDNCPISANANQGNEDGDRFGDVCDPCPYIADDNPPDGDMDGVGDACDPNPVFFGDVIILFEGFHAGVPFGWDQTGTWTPAGDDAMVSGDAMMAVQLTARTRETVMASITIDSVGQGAYAGVLDNKAKTTSSAITCTLTAPGDLVLGDPAPIAQTTYQMTAGATYLIRLRRDNNSYTCDAANGAATAKVMKNSTLVNDPYLSGLTLSGVTAHVHWVMLMESL